MGHQGEETIDGQSGAAAGGGHVPRAANLELAALVTLADELIGQSHGVGARICQKVAEISAQRARLVLHGPATGLSIVRAVWDFPVPVRFGGHEYGVVDVNALASDPSTPSIPLDEVCRLCRAVGMVIHTLELAMLVRSLAERVQHATPESLTCREREVLASMARGRDCETIAEQLCITPATVSKHQEHIYEKLDAHNLVDAILIAHHAGLTRYVVGDDPAEPAKAGAARTPAAIT